MLQESIWRKEVEDHQKHPHQKHSRQKLFHQKLTSSEAEDHQKLKNEAEVYWKLSFHFYINAEGIEAWSNSRFRGIWAIGCLSIEERIKRTIVQLYNQYLHYLCLQQYYSIVVTTLVSLYSEKGFEIVRS